MTFQLTNNVEACVLCGPSPLLAELEEEVVYKALNVLSLPYFFQSDILNELFNAYHTDG